MSPNDMVPYREAFDEACQRFGWQRVQVREFHERDEDRSEIEEVWLSANRARLFAEEDLTEEMVRELIRLYEVIKVTHGP